MDYDKKTLDELFYYGNKILDELKNSADKKSAALENYKNLREKLQSMLNDANVEEEKF